MKDNYELKLFISTIVIIVAVLATFIFSAIDKAKAEHTAPVYVITLETDIEHKVLKFGYVFKELNDIHHLMNIFKHDQSGGIITNQLFKTYLEYGWICEVPLEFYNVILISKHDFYDVYEVVRK